MKEEKGTATGCQDSDEHMAIEYTGGGRGSRKQICGVESRI